MILEEKWSGNTIVLYSVGQAAARIGRTAKTVRRLEREGSIPAPFKRSRSGQRLYTLHECKAIEVCFKKHNIRERVKIPEAFITELADAFAALRQVYQLPKWSLTMLPQEYV
jgi:hypothetical protein